MSGRGSRIALHPEAAEGRVIRDIPKNSTSTIRVQLRTYENPRLCDARVYVRKDDDSLTPTKKGLCVRVSQIAALISALQEAESVARQMGWLTADPAQRRAA